MAEPAFIHGEDSPPRSPRARRGSTTLQAAATLNAGLQQEVSRRSSASSLRHMRSPSSGRRRSTILMNLQLNDPAVPAPGEMVNDERTGSINGLGTSSPRLPSGSPLLQARDNPQPHHHRAPSLGELHQELEAEQEAQVNRLLHMIRQQQLQLQQLQAAQGHAVPSADDTSAISDRSMAQPTSIPGSGPPSALPGHSGSFSQSPRHRHPRSSFDMARADLHRRSRTPSRGASRGASPRLRSTSISGDVNDGMALNGRDESAFYQAETQMLVRENQMLKHRIRELEKQLSETHVVPSIPHEPSNHSQLARTPTTDSGVVAPKDS